MADEMEKPLEPAQVAMVRYFDQDTGKEIKQLQLRGTAGQKIAFDLEAHSADYRQQGYQLVANGLPASAKYQNGDQTYAVILKHGRAVIKPQEQLDPAIEKLGVARDQYWRDYTKTVYFVTATGSPLAQSSQQRSTWTRQLTVDLVTGKIFNKDEPWSCTRQRYADVTVPVIKGYYADQTVVKGEERAMQEINQKVIYRPVGKIIPVDEAGQPLTAGIPYTNDPKDPTKVLPNEALPQIAGYKTEDKTISPSVAGENTLVKYQRDIRRAVISYLDSTTGTTLATDKVSGGVETKITYTPDQRIQYYRDRGYRLVGNTFLADAKYRASAGMQQDFKVTLEHGTKLVSVDMPQEGGGPINPNDPAGPTWPGQDAYDRDFSYTVNFINLYGHRLCKDRVQRSHWTRTIKVDLVTGKIINPRAQWFSSASHYRDVPVPVVQGYY